MGQDPLVIMAVAGRNNPKEAKGIPLTCFWLEVEGFVGWFHYVSPKNGIWPDANINRDYKQQEAGIFG